MIVTSFSSKGYEDYGKQFIESYYKHCNYPLKIFTEEPIDIETECLWDIPGCKKFVNLIRNETARPVQNGYRFNTHKFCRKVFATNYVATRHKGVVAWLDADTIFKKDIPDGFIEDLVKDVYVAYLGRDNFHSETGFIAYDTTHKMNGIFQTLYLMAYTTGAYHNLRYWCDSDVFDHIRVLLSVPGNDLNIVRDWGDSFGKSVLGEYMDHFKGHAKYVDKRRLQVRAV